MFETPAFQSERTREGLGLLALLVFAACLRWFAWTQTTVLFNDGPVFLALAQAIDAGHWAAVLAHPYHPLYPALTALVAQTSLTFESSAVVVSIFGGLLGIVAIFLFVRRSFDKNLAWLSAWTVALHPWAVDFSSDVMSDGLYSGLYLLGFAAMASLVEKPRLRTGLAFGTAMGLAYLTRPEGLGLGVVCGVLLVARSFSIDPADRRRLVVASAAMALAAGLVMAPLLGALFAQTGQLQLTQKKSLAGLAAGRAQVESLQGGLALEGAHAISIPMPRSSEQRDGGGAVRPPRSVFGFLEAVSRVARTSLAALRYEIAVIALLGVWSMWSKVRFFREGVVALPVALYSGLLVLLVWGAGYVARRHALAALLPICAYAALGWRWLHLACVDRFGSRSLGRAARMRRPGVVLLCLVVGLTVVWGPRDLRVRRSEREGLRLAAEWLAQNASSGGAVEGSAVAAQKLRVAYYAGARYVPLPSGRDGPIEAGLRGQGVGWVVIGESDLTDHQGLAEGVGDWLVPVYSVEAQGHRALVLEIRPEPAI